MLEPTEADLPALFGVLVVLPLVVYILLGKWGEATKKRERVSLLAQLAAEETIRTGEMATATVMPLVSSFNNEPSTIAVSSFSSLSATRSGRHACARCFSPAKTRCSKCKSVRYCSGKCQIIHWRQVHKFECYQLETTNSNSSPETSSSEESLHEQLLVNEGVHSQFFGYNNKPSMMQNIPSDNVTNHSRSTLTSAMVDSETEPSQFVMHDQIAVERQGCYKSDRGSTMGKEKALYNLSEEASEGGNTNTIYSNASSADNSISEDESPRKLFDSNFNGYIHYQPTSSVLDESQQHQNQQGIVSKLRSNSRYLNPPYRVKNGIHMGSGDANTIRIEGASSRKEDTSIDEMAPSNCRDMEIKKGSKKTNGGLSHVGFKCSKLPKSEMNIPERKPCSDTDRRGQVLDNSKSKMKDTTRITGSEGTSGVGIVRMMDQNKTKSAAKHNTAGIISDRHKKIKMLFPYEEFIKYFQCSVYGLLPRGLINCGNSCYANAVLQCLTCTKPLLIYLLHRSHSRTCCGKAWCLICELEDYVMMLRESGGPLSPSGILLHMRSFNGQLGDGSQEDAHEFLRLLIALMQSICLEGQGGESRVEPRLQETTFIQHTFGGRLRSKVQCLRCLHESERYENIMDLTLEIFGWVESLEDALTQFTTPEDLDGENMYRCGSCAAYVRAQKQLRIHEAPNILTIVLKRFQEGKYGKINKCIAFPEILDMIPFMTETGDVPPLYMLYGVVVHLDTLNASFSGHYVSYVKDMQGNWYRIDDTEVQPVSISQVMSEGAYILFYMRSWPRPQSTMAESTINNQPCKGQKISKIPSTSRNVGCELSDFLRPETVTDFMKHPNSILRRADKNILPQAEPYAEFSDAASTDWSLFTSSDEASFTTESTRDSFSTVDYADAYNTDPLSIFNNLYGQDYTARNTVSCRTYMNSGAETRILYEGRGYVNHSNVGVESLDGLQESNSVDWLHNS